MTHFMRYCETLPPPLTRPIVFNNHIAVLGEDLAFEGNGHGAHLTRTQ
jgi:hypothetical protein